MTNTKKAENVLPQDRSQALQKLIKLSEQILGLAERETQALLQDDIVVFDILQQEKDLISRHYAKASDEFRTRLEEFRSADPGLLDRLDALQKQLGEKTRSNNIIVEKMFARSQKQTRETLITAQELGQKKPMRFANGNAEQKGA